MRILLSVSLLLVRVALVAAVVLVVRSVTMAETEVLIANMQGGAHYFHYETPGGEPFGPVLTRLVDALQRN